MPEEDYITPLGKAEIKREGKDITVIAYSRMLPLCLKAADDFAEEGISVEVIDPMTLKPLDTDAIIKSAKKTGRVLIVHEACTTGGIGGEIAAVIAGSEAFHYLKTPIKRLGGLDIPVPFSKELERAAVPTAEKINRALRELINK